jgi:methionyl-tRNA formyltransferase
MENINIIFMGTPDFSVPALEAIQKEYGVKAVVTVPDKPKGRGKKLLPSPIKEKAMELNIPVLQPDSLKDEDFLAEIAKYNPDIFCVIAFRILPSALYEMPKIASFNIHGSLLPKYRGAAPINHAIINGEQKTGLTSFILQKQVDTGDILLKKEVEIPKYATFGDIYNSLKPLAAELSLETIELLISGEYSPIKQNDEVATPAPKIFRDNTKIDWNKDVDEVINFIHGVSPIPCAWTEMSKERIKVYRVQHSEKCDLKPAEFRITDDCFSVGAKNGCIDLIEFQLPGKKAVRFEDFIKGWRGDKHGFFS